MAVANDIAAKIVTVSLGTAIGTDIFLGAAAVIPSKPENVGPYISLIDTGGTAAMEAHDQRYPRPSIQVVVRAASSPVAKAKAEALHAALCALYNVTINSTFYLKIKAVQEVLDMQKDEVGRPRWGFNLQIVSR